MSLFGKVKEMLFEEEEYTEPIKIRDEEEKTPKIVKLEPEDEKEEKIEEVKKAEVKEEAIKREKEIEREITPAPTENTFQFPVFDEEEFSSNIGKSNSNVLERERRRNHNERDASRLEKVDNNYHDKKKFTPSPIISPVYGILNQDYRAEDIVQRENVASNIDIDTVRKKVFEEVKKEEIIDDTIDEPVVTFFEEKEEKEEKEVKSRSKKNDIKEEVVEDNKSIDDLLEEASTEISLEDTLEMPALSSNLDEIEKELEKLDDEEKVEESKEEKENTLTEDADLYELIDSMYEDREEV